jgi:uncharacterized protein YjbI with pentapeptide repeats
MEIEDVRHVELQPLSLFGAPQGIRRKFEAISDDLRARSTKVEFSGALESSVCPALESRRRRIFRQRLVEIVPDRDLSFANLSGASLQRYVVKDFNLREANFSHTDCVASVVERVEAQESDFLESNCRLTRWKKTTLEGASMRHVDFSGADLFGIDFTGCDLSYASFRGASIRQSKLDSSLLAGCNFRGAHMTECTFDHAELHETDFSFATFSHCDLSIVDLNEANFYRAAWNGGNKDGGLPSKAPDEGDCAVLHDLDCVRYWRRRPKLVSVMLFISPTWFPLSTAA